MQYIGRESWRPPSAPAASCRTSSWPSHPRTPRTRRSSSCRLAFFSRSNRILCASVPSSISDSLNQGCCRASLAVMRFFGSYTNIRLRRSRNCLLKSVCPGIVSCTCQSAQAVVTGNTYVKLLHRLDIFLGCLVGVRVGIV